MGRRIRSSFITSVALAKVFSGCFMWPKIMIYMVLEEAMKGKVRKYFKKASL